MIHSPGSKNQSKWIKGYMLYQILILAIILRVTSGDTNNKTNSLIEIEKLIMRNGKLYIKSSKTGTIFLGSYLKIKNGAIVRLRDHLCVCNN